MLIMPVYVIESQSIVKLLQEWVSHVTIAHSPSFPSLHLRHSSFSNPSVALPTSQLILKPFRGFTQVTAHSPNSSFASLTSLGEPPMPKQNTYITLCNQNSCCQHIRIIKRVSSLSEVFIPAFGKTMCLLHNIIVKATRHEAIYRQSDRSEKLLQI